MTVFQCLSCRLPLAPGVAHGSSAECAAALAAEIERLKARLSLREKLPLHGFPCFFVVTG
jgi:hypothetical protein